MQIERRQLGMGRSMSAAVRMDGRDGAWTIPQEIKQRSLQTISSPTPARTNGLVLGRLGFQTQKLQRSRCARKLRSSPALATGHLLTELQGPTSQDVPQRSVHSGSAASRAVRSESVGGRHGTASVATPPAHPGAASPPEPAAGGAGGPRALRIGSGIRVAFPRVRPHGAWQRTWAPRQPPRRAECVATTDLVRAAFYAPADKNNTKMPNLRTSLWPFHKIPRRWSMLHTWLGESG